MKLHTADFPRKSQFPLMLALGMLPVCAAVILHNAPEALPALAYLIPAYLLSAWICLLLPGKLRLPAALLFCAGILLLGFYTAHHKRHIPRGQNHRPRQPERALPARSADALRAADVQPAVCRMAA